MGEVVGKAASICVAHECGPRQVYDQYLGDLKKLLELPGVARRDSVTGPIYMSGPVPPPAAVEELKVGINPASLPGKVIDNRLAEMSGKWGSGTGLAGYIGLDYVYAGPASNASARFPIAVDASGVYEIRLAYRDHENRASNASVEVRHDGGSEKRVIDMKKAPPLASGFLSLGKFKFSAGRRGAVVVSAKGANGNVCVDAIQILPAE